MKAIPSNVFAEKSHPTPFKPFLSFPSSLIMTQKKISKAVFNVDGLFTAGHARRCEAMIRNSAGGIESVKADEVMGTVTIIYDAKMQTPHSIRDIVDDTGYTVL